MSNHQELEDRFWSKVVRGHPEQCWIWQGAKYAKGYPYLWFHSKKLRATHASLLLFRGEYVPDGMVCCHSCDTPSCVNPDHLWIGTIADNNRDCREKGHHGKQKITHCPKGHPYDETNTGYKAHGTERYCKTCRSELRQGKRVGEYRRRVESAKRRGLRGQAVHGHGRRET